MDQNSAIFDDNLKNEVKKNLIMKIITGLELKQVSLAQKKDSANFILDHIDTIKDYSKFILFMDELKSKWPFFLDTYNLYKNKFYQEKEKAVIDRLTNYIHKLN